MRDLTITITADDSQAQPVLARADAGVAKIEGSATATTLATDKLQASFAKLVGQGQNVDDRAKRMTETLEKLGLSNLNVAKGVEAVIPAEAEMAAGFGFATTAAAGLAAGAVLVGVGLFKLAEHAASVGDRLSDLKDKTGLSVPALSQLKFAADVAGDSVEHIAQAMFTFQQRVGQDSEQVIRGLKRLGLSLDDIKTMEPSEQFLAIARGIKEIHDPTQRAAAVMELFGRQGREMLPLLSKDLDELVERSKALGFTWTNDEAKAAETFEMSVRALKVELGNLVVILGRDLIESAAGVVKALESMLQAAARIQALLPKGAAATVASVPAIGVGPAIGSLAADWGQAGLDLFLGTIHEMPEATGAAALGVQRMRDAAAALALQDTTTAERTAALKGVFSMLNDESRAAIAAWEAHQKALAAVNLKIEEATRDIGNLTATQKDSVLAYHALGLSNEEIALKLNVSVLAVKAYETEFDNLLKRFGSNEAAAAAFQKGLQRVLVGYNETGEAAVGFTGILHRQDPLIIQNADSLIRYQKQLDETAAAFKKAFGMFAGVSLGPVAGLESGQIRINNALKTTIKTVAQLNAEFELSQQELSATGQAFAHLGQLLAGTGAGSVLSALSVVIDAVIKLRDLMHSVGQATAESAGATSAGWGAASAAISTYALAFTAGFTATYEIGKMYLDRNKNEIDQLRNLFLGLQDHLSTLGEAYVLAGRDAADAWRDWQTASTINNDNLEEARAALVRINSAIINQNQLLEMTRALNEQIAKDQKEQDDEWQHLLATLKKYNISLTEAGPLIAQKHLVETAKELFFEFTELTKAGVPLNTVLDRMSGSFNELVHQALLLGLELPSALRPILEQLARAGLLTDQFGNKITDVNKLKFSETLSEGFDRLISRLDLLLERLGLIVGAASAAGSAMGGIFQQPGGLTPPTGGAPTLPSAPGFGTFGGTASRVLPFRVPSVSLNPRAGVSVGGAVNVTVHVDGYIDSPAAQRNLARIVTQQLSQDMQGRRSLSRR